MNDKQSKIAAFIDSLPANSSLEDCQSTLLSVNMDYMGGDNG